MPMDINIVTLCGSAREGNYTAKALAVVHEELARHERVKVTPIDLCEVGLQWPGRPATPSTVAFRETVAAATGVIIATPEYHGTYSSLIKLAIENMGFPSALERKPMMLLGVAQGQIGAIKSLEHLRSVCSHVGAIVMPSFISIANVRDVIDENGVCQDERTGKMLRKVGTVLLDYINDHIWPRLVLEAMVRGLYTP